MLQKLMLHSISRELYQALMFKNINHCPDELKNQGMQHINSSCSCQKTTDAETDLGVRKDR